MLSLGPDSVRTGTPTVSDAYGSIKDAAIAPDGRVALVLHAGRKWRITAFTAGGREKRPGHAHGRRPRGLAGVQCRRPARDLAEPRRRRAQRAGSVTWMLKRIRHGPCASASPVTSALPGAAIGSKETSGSAPGAKKCAYGAPSRNVDGDPAPLALEDERAVDVGQRLVVGAVAEPLDPALARRAGAGREHVVVELERRRGAELDAPVRARLARELQERVPAEGHGHVAVDLGRGDQRVGGQVVLDPQLVREREPGVVPRLRGRDQVRPLLLQRPPVPRLGQPVHRRAEGVLAGGADIDRAAVELEAHLAQAVRPRVQQR